MANKTEVVKKRK